MISKFNKSNFLLQKKEEKYSRELERKKIEMASKIFIFYKNTKICNDLKKSMIQQYLPKIQTALSVQFMKDLQTFYKVCNITLNKCPEFLKPFFLLNKKNVQNNETYVLNMLQLFSGCLQIQQNNFVFNLFKGNQFLMNRLHFSKALYLGFYLIQTSKQADNFIKSINEILISIHQLLSACQLDLFYAYFYRLDTQILQNNLPQLIVQKGFEIFLFYYLNLNRNQQASWDLGFNYVMMIEQNSSFDFSDLMNHIKKSQQYNQLISMILTSELELQQIRKLFNKLQILTIPNSELLFEILTQLLQVLEQNFYRMNMPQDYKNLQYQNNSEHKKLKILRKKKEFIQFTDQINFSKLLSLLEKPQFSDLSSTSKFIYYLVNIGQNRKLEIIQQMQKLRYIDNDFTKYLLNLSKLKEFESIPVESISVYCYFKANEFQLLDDKEFRNIALKNEAVKQELNEIFGFIIEYAKFCISYNVNQHIYKELKLFIREIFDRNQILNFYQWKYENMKINNHIPFFSLFSQRIQKFNQYLEEDKKQFNRNILAMLTYDEFGEPIMKQSMMVVIRRGEEFQDAFDQLEKKQLKNMFHVKFVNQMGIPEDGIDAGGVTKEFITRVVNQALDPTFGLFIETPEKTMIPNPAFMQEEKQKYAFIGKIIGKAIYEGVLIEKVLNQVFLNQVLGITNTINDFRFYDSDQYHRICNLKNQDVTDFGLTFSITQEFYGQIVEFDLIPNGRQINVTNENKISYINLYCHFRLNKQIKEQSQIFRAGLEQVIDPEKFKLFTNQELQLLISGQPVIDIQDLISNTKYQGYQPYDKTIEDFWSVVNDFEYEQQSQFLFFFSSCSRAPTQGFKSLDPPFMIQKVPIHHQSEMQKLPTASTCFNILKLPDYRNRDILREKLVKAISSNTGFELT
ncbi:unnamed protein product (macronuclear) [Paramecium tetraurelia]|uniref:HECT-type E3 ubiquitin transferase n=1 Tax=Paramecium tetraurelia TaxID=5888 RepID=Q6BGB8_PARTE|nr:Ubiquitin protein ligase [Paramecium tetraurelia strain d4-2]XP_001423399.1 uncharacterized protein GSPATT00000436001 [Paramecium tetraurelia]CAH03302.1 Ubiquitin protein ligase, putative [Paramecium tetraurelia]CAK56001.1 unnamed protein product [Paramecium tetraurelia]|eukprot:XP_001423399.1 hypothetical protein (macronuclear) [Paramecium tetraurelia strain d4-2]